MMTARTLTDGEREVLAEIESEAREGFDYCDHCGAVIEWDVDACCDKRAADNEAATLEIARIEERERQSIAAQMQWEREQLEVDTDPFGDLEPDLDQVPY